MGIGETHDFMQILGIFFILIGTIGVISFSTLYMLKSLTLLIGSLAILISIFVIWIGYKGQYSHKSISIY